MGQWHAICHLIFVLLAHFVSKEPKQSDERTFEKDNDLNSVRSIELFVVGLDERKWSRKGGAVIARQIGERENAIECRHIQAVRLDSPRIGQGGSSKVVSLAEPLSTTWFIFLYGQ